jgi:hypothetical protein
MLKSSKSAPHSVLKNLRGANKEAQGRYLGDVAQRERAANILNPNEVSGEYDAGRTLLTTFGGGELRALTHDDLRAFRENVKRLGKKYKGGITAKTVIDMSLAEDRERANKQINVAVPVQSMDGLIHFMTNAGPDSEVTRHHIKVNLLNFGAAVASPSKMADLVKTLAAGPLAFDCDCGRHKFWYRYIATVGRYNAGRAETGFPKIRNPHLTGVACKHVLRVMQQIGSPSVRIQLEKMINKARGEVARTSKLLTAKEVQEIAARQQQEANWKRNLIESSSERATRLARTRAVQSAAQRARTKVAALTPPKLAAEKRKFEMNARRLIDLGVLTAKQVQAMLAKIKG